MEEEKKVEVEIIKNDNPVNNGEEIRREDGYETLVINPIVNETKQIASDPSEYSLTLYDTINGIVGEIQIPDNLT